MVSSVSHVSVVVKPVALAEPHVSVVVEELALVHVPRVLVLGREILRLITAKEMCSLEFNGTSRLQRSIARRTSA